MHHLEPTASQTPNPDAALEVSALHKWALIAMTTAVLTACTTEQAGEATIQPMQAAPATKAPTMEQSLDPVAAQIQKAIELYKETQEKAFTPKQFKPADKKTLGYSFIATQAYAQNAHEAIQAIGYPITKQDVADIHIATTRIDQIPNAASQLTMEGALSDQVVNDVLTSVQSNELELPVARELLAAIDKKLPGKMEGILDTLDAAGAVTYNFDNPKAILADLRDIPGSSPAKKLAETVVDADDSSAKVAAESELYKLKDGVAKTVDKYSAANLTAYDRLASVTNGAGPKLDKLIAHTIKSHNKIPSKNVTTMLPELKNPDANIDLTGVTGSKKFFGIEEDGTYKVQSGEFGEVYASDGKIQIAFAKNSGLTPTAEAQMQRLIGDVEPIINAAMSNGDLLAVRFVIADDDEFDPYYSTALHEVRFVLSSTDPLSEDQFRSGLTHELTHSLVNSAFNQESTVSDKEATLVRNACNALSGEAYSRFISALELNDGSLDHLIQTSTGTTKKTFMLLKKAADNGTLAKTVENSILKYADKKNLEDTTCTDYTIGDVLVTLMRDAGIDRADDVYKMFSDKLIASKNKYFSKLLDTWSEAIDDHSLFKQLNESSFVKTQSLTKEYLGHSRDNANELMATVTDVTLNYTDQVRDLIAGLRPDDQKIVLQAVSATYAVIIDRHPELKAYLTKIQKELQQ